MSISRLLGAGVLMVIAGGSFQPAHGMLELPGKAPVRRVRLPRCDTQRAKTFLNHAMSMANQVNPVQIETINSARQTNLGIHGTRECSGSLTSVKGRIYTGSWSFAHADDIVLDVKFSIQPVGGSEPK